MGAAPNKIKEGIEQKPLDTAVLRISFFPRNLRVTMKWAATPIFRKRQEPIGSGLSPSTKFKYRVHCMGCLSCAVFSPEDTGMYLCYSVLYDMRSHHL